MATYTNARHRVQRSTAHNAVKIAATSSHTQRHLVTDSPSLVTAQSSGASYTRAARKFLSREDGIDDSPIPRADFGVIDTMKVRLDIRGLREARRHGILMRDFEDLLQDRGWFRADVSSCGRNPPVQRLVNYFNGVRISEYDTCIAVEASIPRVLGLTNVNQHLATDRDAMSLLNMVQFELLPRTTSRSATGRFDQHWHVTRLDVSVNFEADRKLLIEALRHVRHPSIRNEPDVYGHKGVGIYGSDRDFIVYDAHAKHRRNKLARKVRDKLIERAAPGTMRLEFRYKCAKSVRAALERVDERARAFGIDSTTVLPFATSRSELGTSVGYAPVRNWLLHELLAYEVLALTGTRSMAVPQGLGSLPNRCAVAYLAEHPELLAQLANECSAPTVRKYRRLVAAHLLDVRSTSLLQLAWCSRSARRAQRSAATFQGTAT